MKITKTLLAGLFATALQLHAGEPFLLKKDNGSSFLKTKPATSEQKKMQANMDGYSNIVIKMNLTQLAFTNLSFQAEYGFHKKLSAALGISYLLDRRMAGNLYDEADPYFTTPRMSGFAITPELRFYPGGKEEKPAPRGFYLAPYLRYAKYSVKQVVSYQDDAPGSKLHEADATHSYAGYNVGLMIGRQWIIGKHFSIDWWIIGAGYGKAKYAYKWQADDANLTAAQQADVKQQAQEYFDEFSLFGLEGDIETTPKSATMNVRGLPMYSLRFMGLCVGYAF